MPTETVVGLSGLTGFPSTLLRAPPVTVKCAPSILKPSAVTEIR
jgi:hypothetical protein